VNNNPKVLRYDWGMKVATANSEKRRTGRYTCENRGTVEVIEEGVEIGDGYIREVKAWKGGGEVSRW
jgi:hypothetical protein